MKALSTELAGLAAAPVVLGEGPTQVPLDSRRFRRAKTAYTTRYVDALRQVSAEGYRLAVGDQVVPQPGDVVLATVAEIGQHQRLELACGRKARLFEGDEILVAYGGRYATDQFEAEIPPDLGPAHLVAAGGLIGKVLSSHLRMLPATALEPVGLLTDSRGIVTLSRCSPYQLPAEEPLLRSADGLVTLAVVGTSMNSGKTTTVGAIVRGLTAAGLDVVAGKVTGTGAGNDPGLFRDSGASRVLDFTDFGYPSTYKLPHEEVRSLLSALQAELSSGGPDVVVLEIADGLFQAETSRLVADPLFSRMVDRVVFTAGEALGAWAGVTMLRQHRIEVAAVSGLLTSSPLAMAETAAAVQVPVLTMEDLATPVAAMSLLRPTDTAAGSLQPDERVAV